MTEVTWCLYKTHMRNDYSNADLLPLFDRLKDDPDSDTISFASFLRLAREFGSRETREVLNDLFMRASGDQANLTFVEFSDVLNSGEIPVKLDVGLPQ